MAVENIKRILLVSGIANNQNLKSHLEKTYEIEVFAILGNKVMELVGNSIKMEHLSNATYIVNALDVETQESLSYKVIKK